MWTHPTVASHLLLRVAPFPMWSAIVATARVTLQKTARSAGYIVSSAMKLDTGPGTVQEMKQRTRHQRQPSPSRRCECSAPSSEHLCWRSKGFSTNWHQLLANNHWCRSMLVLEESDHERDNDWKMTHECWGWQSRWNTVNCGGSEEAWFQTLLILSHDRQCSLYVGGLSGTFRCVVGSVWLAEFSRGGQELGWRDKGLLAVGYIWDCGLCVARRYSPWRLVCRWTGTEHVSRCKLLSDRSIIGDTKQCLRMPAGCDLKTMPKILA